MFSKPNVIIYLRRNGLVLAGKRLTPARLKFPAEIVNNLEVLKPDTLKKACLTFFEEHEVRGKRVLLVLDDSVVFCKQITLGESTDPAELAQEFTDAMPFEAGNRACLRLRNQNELRLFATNAEFYACVASALNAVNGTKLLAITPASAYDFGEPVPQLAAAISEFINNTEIRSKVDFSATAPL